MFNSHLNSLTDIYYAGTEEEWNTITIASDNDRLTAATIHYSQESEETETGCLGHTITLDESISLNYYFSFSDELLEDDGAKVVISKNDVVESELLISDAVIAEKDGVSGYVFSCGLVTKEMADTVTASVVDSEGNTVCIDEYSAQEYCENLLELNEGEGGDAELVSLVKALMNYGASAQEYFGYNTDNPVNESLSSTDKVIADIPSGALDSYATNADIDSGSGKGISI